VLYYGGVSVAGVWLHCLQTSQTLQLFQLQLVLLRF
jgi:hypothetical protein